MHDLLKLKRASNVEAYLGSLPKGLQKAYQRILDDIGNQAGSAPVTAARALRWTMDSVAPLSTEELVAAVCQSSDGLVPHDLDIDTEFVLEACHNLVVVMGSTCRFSHLSVQEYLEGHDWPNKPDDQLLGAVCMHLLMAPEDILTGSALNKYAACYWYKHFTDCDPEAHGDRSVAAPLLSKFLGHPTNSSDYYRKWVKTLSVWWPKTRIIGHNYDLQPSQSAAFGVVALGLLATAARWIRDGTLDPNLCSDYSCLLHLAVKSRNLAMCSQLVKAGADVNYSIMDLGTPLLRAVLNRQYSIIELLVKQPGIDADIGRDMNGATALCNAVVMGSRSIVKLLLKGGANPNLLEEVEDNRGSAYRGFTPALHIAASEGKIDIVRILIQGGANVNLVAGGYQTPLANAVWFQHEAIVQLLIREGADVDLFRPLYHAVPEVGVTMTKVSRALIDGGALDHVLDLPQAERTELDESYEDMVDWLDNKLAKSDKERSKRRFMRMFDAGTFRAFQGEEEGGSEYGVGEYVDSSCGRSFSL